MVSTIMEFVHKHNYIIMWKHLHCMSSRNYLPQLCQNSVDNGNYLCAMDNYNISYAVNTILQVLQENKMH